ncbi:glycerol-3-phosphate-acyltransferase [Crucibulum laeve]|uniref:Glycerol-3-phosphate-acyltransferase n=1 Tax=Crucibulum laeve TaxID=68775 RepID=A0A5C3MID9_9AGAR|nr:glycerol-3-phosphate-acyltransferase [Crucibulum laeve]
MSSSSDVKVLHRVIRFISSLAVSSFFTEVHVIGGEHVPKDGPIIVTATHHNMILDPVVLSVAFPYQRILNYWSKASLYKNPIMRYILLSSGNIPVDRKSKDRQILFKGTIEALAKGEAVALFPEGTSYTEPRIMQIKDGAAWAALEYMKWAQENPDKASSKPVTIIPAAIVYTNKSKYRSGVIMEFGRPISMDEYQEQFMSSAEGASRAAVKRLSRQIESELVEASVNASDWDTLYAARMARDLLWERERSINLDDFVTISQTLVDLFSTPDATNNFKSVKRYLLTYYSLLQSSHLTNSVLSTLPLPRSLDPNTPAAVPGRLRAILVLFRDSVSSLSRLPFFFVPLIVHLPVYIMGRVGARLVEQEEETQAQNKVAFGLLSLLIIYSTIFFFLWSLFMYTPIGAFVAAATVYWFAVYHIKLIDDNYMRAKRFIAAWRVLVGVWMPKRWELSMNALSQYTTPWTPPENPWIDKNKKKAPESDDQEKSKDAIPPVRAKSPTDLALQEEPPVQSRPVRRPPSRRIVRHVLRARVEAVKALAGFFDQLERTGSGKRVKASVHLAKLYGGVVQTEGKLEDASTAEVEEGWRHAKEVIDFLKKRGAKIPTLGQDPLAAEWAALSSEGEGYTTSEEKDEPVWVPASIHK